ncbi:Mor transcription activator family protein [Cellulosilyticum sp. I15G10I2]|uniref:Mor transcription activator family protein n=1 Tax=Cellulosilyticum sp. I15G10I2 TaxID=1892843 RepID=UPI00085CCCB3|nr:Mor transcription activator family protein [Cellulosilyticum sp. I15G10I2]
MDEWIKEVTIDMVPEAYKSFVEKMGLKSFLNLAQIAGGTTMYIPKLDNFVRQVRDEKIKKEFNGYNQNKIGLKYNISARRVLEICRVDMMEGQASIFDNP